MSAPALASIAPIASPQALMQTHGAALNPAAQTSGVSFTQMLTNGIQSVNQKVAHADSMVRAFALDDSIPLHQVTFALEEARLSVELMMQVRSRLVETYQRMMEMQL